MTTARAWHGAGLLLVIPLTGCGPAPGQAERDLNPEPWEHYLRTTEIEVASNPPGARIEINGEEKGVTPVTVSYRRGGRWGVPNSIVIEAIQSDSLSCAHVVKRDEPPPTRSFFDMAECGARDPPRDRYEVEVDVKPELMVVPRLEYPDDLVRMGIPGAVLVEAVIDTSGTIDPETLNMLYCSDRRFVRPTRSFMLSVVYKPGEVEGSPVRTLVQQPMRYTIDQCPREPCPRLGETFNDGPFMNQCAGSH